ncbi:MAG TPA: helix-turn-helix domain-containing protein [Dermatophilaceae bacterium]|nr:helix-turn-helix domain-containing protein [Dermatophilaceae bacterium]
MPPARPSVSTATRRRVRGAAGNLGAAAVQQIEADHAWYRVLSAENRSWAGLVAQNGISAFVDWFTGDHRGHVTTDVFGSAPPELARSITLAQTLSLLRTVVDVVEREVTGMVTDREVTAVREAVLRYSREVAFSAAEVYAQAAESRGAWDARLESLVVDAVIRGEADDAMQSRAAALGWGATTSVAAVVGVTPHGDAQQVIDGLHRAAKRLGHPVLVAVHGRRLLALLGAVADPVEAAGDFAPLFGEGPLVVGPVVPHLLAAGRSARAALSGYAAAPAWPAAPRPVRADDLLAERALLGDQPARTALVQRIYTPLHESSGGHLLATAAAYLDGGSGLEATARALFVHPNTVRYRLAGIARTVGYDLGDPHDAHTVRLALAFGRLAASDVRAPAGRRDAQLEETSITSG